MLKTNETLTIKGGFDNAKGKIEASGNVTINGLNKTTDLEAAPATIVMGDITLTNATLTNNDKGYTLKTEAEKKEGEGTDKRVPVAPTVTAPFFWALMVPQVDLPLIWAVPVPTSLVMVSLEPLSRAPSALTKLPPSLSVTSP